MAQIAQTIDKHERIENREATTGDWRESWATAALVLIMLLTVTSSVALANWADGVGYAPYAATAGFLFAALVTRLRLPGWLAHPLMLLEGTFVTALLMSNIVQPSFATWNEKVVIMETRLWRWATAVTSGGIGTDALLFAMLLSALAFLVGYVATWSVFRRHQPWGAILPMGAALLLNQFYAPPQSGVILMAFLLCSMLLLVRITLVTHEASWRQKSVRYANDIGFDFITYGIVFSGIVILTSWLVPPTAPGPQWFAGVSETVRGPWQDLSDNVSRAFSTVRQANTGGPTTMFGSSLSMGGPIHLGNRPVLDVQATQGRYWRAVVFDKYTGIGWVSSSPGSDSFGANDQRMKPPPISLARSLTQTVTVLMPGDNLMVAATDPLQISEPVDAKYSPLRLGSDLIYQDFSQFRFQRRLNAGDKYTVVSEVSGADVGALRTAGTNYPADIRQRYLQLPSTVPARVRNLAIQLTSQNDNNYDRATAIEQYLRTNIKYDDNVSAPPTDRDGVDYTLFDRPAGYCNYYASAMAVLAREVGIPARIASGYSNGDAQNGVYHLNEGQAHTWPELYFPGLGWVPFEPTANKPDIVRPVKQADVTPTPSGTQEPDFIPTRSPRISPRNLDNQDSLTPGPGGLSLPWPSGIAGALASLLTGGLFIGFVTLGVVQYTWLRRVRLLPPGARAWEEMNRLAPLVGYDESAPSTPLERASELRRAVPDAGRTIDDVTDLYVRERYGAHRLTEDEVARTASETRVLHRELLLAAVRRGWNQGPMRLVKYIRALPKQISTRKTPENQ